MQPIPTADEILASLRDQANPDNVEGMARYGINPEGTLGVSMPALRDLARDIKKVSGRKAEGLQARHELAEEIWTSGLHEARILAALVDVPKLVDRDQMEAWVADLDSWDVCDQLCLNLFRQTEYAYDVARDWPDRDEEFVKRAGFVMMATLAVHDKQAGGETFMAMLPVIEQHAFDDRNFVKKSVNWALRQIGKRDMVLNEAAVTTAEGLAASDSKPARWVGSNAHRELTSEKIRSRLADL